METQRLYGSLASLWPLFSPPEEYVEEVETFRRRLHAHGVADGSTILHLGSGGGSIDYHLAQGYRVTGVDSSAAMIEQARLVNPGVEYIEADIRNVRLDRTFDAVLVHDAIASMTSTAELEAVYRSAAHHLRAGGVMLALPEELRQRLALAEPSVDTRVDGMTVLHVMTTYHDDDPSDNSYETVYVFLLRERGQLRVEVDRHIGGVFELEDFMAAIRAAGFAATAERWELTWDDEPELPLITAIRLPDTPG